MSNTELGTGYVSLWPKIKGDLGDDGARLGKQFGASIENGVRSSTVAIGNLISSVIQSTLGSVGSMVSDALSASDSLAKFEQTMGFAGFDASTIQSARDSMKDYADQTVYDLGVVANTTAQLAANGISDFGALTQAAGNLNAVAGGNAESFKSVSMALTQTAGAGKLTTENWNQLTDAIPGASGRLQTALKEAGAFTGNFRDAMAKGEITAEEFNAAIMALGNDPIAVEAARSVETFEGAVGNLSASIQGALLDVIDSIGMENITGAINAIADCVSAAAPTIANGAKTAFGFIKDHGHAIAAALGAVAAAALGIQTGRAAFRGWEAAKELASTMKDLAVKFGLAGSAGTAAGGGLTTMSAGTKKASTAAKVSAKQMLALAAAIVAIGAGVALAAAGVYILAKAAVMIAGAGLPAAAVLLGMAAGIAALAFGASLIGPALTAGAVGILAFGAAILLVGAGVLLACIGVSALAAQLPAIAASGFGAAGALAALGAGMAVSAAGALLLGAGCVVLGAGLLVASAGLILCSAGAAVLAGALTVIAGAVVVAGAGFLLLGAGLSSAASAMPVIAASGPVAAASLAGMSAAGLGAAAALLALSGPLAAVAGSSAAAAGGLAASVATMSAAAFAAAAGASGGAAMSAALSAAAASAASAAGAFASFAGGVASAMSQASASVSSAIAQMSSAISGANLQVNVTLGPLPHFSFSGKFDPKSGAVPTLSVSWYAKGAVFDSASIIGVGEAGPEAVLPLRKSVLGAIGDGIASSSSSLGGGGVNVYINNAQVNNDEAVERLVYSLLETVSRKKRMGAAVR